MNELRDDDKITAYFHQKASQRKQYDKIAGLFDDDGEWQSSKEDLEHLVLSNFSTLLSSEHPTEFEQALAGMRHLVTDEMNISIDTDLQRRRSKRRCFRCTPTELQGRMVCTLYFFIKFGTL